MALPGAHAAGSSLSQNGQSASKTHVTIAVRRRNKTGRIPLSYHRIMAYEVTLNSRDGIGLAAAAAIRGVAGTADTSESGRAWIQKS